ncbi:GAF domain-containing protein [Orbus wheelerorum]|uniref:GAF domain-containing protein n=1 Tax=Orbus wheelerorum TaxID=3074111 RepID=UPI00370D75DE
MLSVFGVINSFDVSSEWLKDHPFFLKFIRLVIEYSIPSYLLLIVIWVLSKILSCFFSNKKWSLIKSILDYTQKSFFSYLDEPEDYHRVTLFQLKKSYKCSPWFENDNFLKRLCNRDKYLIPILRSGELSQKTNVKFKVCDSSDKSEGIAGRALASRKTISVSNLPCIGEKTTINDIKKYAKDTFSDKNMIEYYRKAKKTMPRSIVAIPIEVKGNLWGVLVFDSRSPEAIFNEGENISGVHSILLPLSIAAILEEKS